MLVISETLSETRVQAGLDPKGLSISITYGVQSIASDCAPEALIARADRDFYGRKGRNGFTRP